MRYCSPFPAIRVAPTRHCMRPLKVEKSGESSENENICRKEARHVEKCIFTAILPFPQYVCNVFEPAVCSDIFSPRNWPPHTYDTEHRTAPHRSFNTAPIARWRKGVQTPSSVNNILNFLVFISFVNLTRKSLIFG